MAKRGGLHMVSRGMLTSYTLSTETKLSLLLQEGEKTVNLHIKLS